MLLGEGENLEVDPPRRLVQTMRALWSDEAKAAGTTRITWEIEPVGDSCRLTVLHDQIPEDATDEIWGGWPMILSGLKTWLETGETPHHPRLAHVHLSRRGLGQQEEPTVALRQISMVTVQVRDLDTVRAWYTDVLGLAVGLAGAR